MALVLPVLTGLAPVFPLVAMLLVVGARSVRWPVPSAQSAAFVYRLDEKTGQWQQQAKIAPQLEVGYINSVAVSERYIVVGDTVAIGKSNTVGEGAAYVFDGQDPELQK